MGIVTDTLNSFGLNRVGVRDVLFLTGAGISAPEPTRFFLGKDLHRIVLENFTNLTVPEIDRVLTKVPFERSCECIDQAFRGHKLSAFVGVFWNLMSELCLWRPQDRWKEPNQLHRYFREHIRQGGSHITANLDQFIELDDLGHLVRTTRMFDDGTPLRDEEGILYKFHGDFERDAEGEQGFVFSAISNDFSNTVQGCWDALLGRARVVVVCGYSGSDIYDVTPYFGSKPNAHFNSCIIWVKHGGPPIQRLAAAGSPDVDMILSKFREMAVLAGRAGDVLNELLPALPPVTYPLKYRVIALLVRLHLIGSVRAGYTQTFTNSVELYRRQYADFDAFKRMAGAEVLAVLATVP
jgi:hypothetical protein